MNPNNQQVVIQIKELTAIIHAVVTDPKIGNSDNMYLNIFNSVKKLSHNDFEKVDREYQKQYKQSLNSVFSAGLGSTESPLIVI